MKSDYLHFVDARARELYFELLELDVIGGDLAALIAQEDAEGEALARFIESQPKSNGGMS